MVQPLLHYIKYIYRLLNDFKACQTVTLSIISGVWKQHCWNLLCFFHQIYRSLHSWPTKKQLVLITGHQKEFKSEVFIGYKPFYLIMGRPTFQVLSLRKPTVSKIIGVFPPAHNCQKHLDLEIRQWLAIMLLIT
jgi:hypothetical protein